MRQVLCIIGFIVSGLAIGSAGCRNTDQPTTQESTAGDEEARKPPQFAKKPAGEAPDMNRLIAEAMRKGGGPDVPPGHAPIPMTMPSDGSGMPAMPPGHPPIGSMPAGHPPVGSMPAMPPGHPPIGGMPAGETASATTLPAGHPPIGGQTGPVAFSGDMAEPEKNLELKPPKDWQAKPARPMTVAIYDLPKASDTSADAELTISQYAGMKNIPLDAQVKRWAGQLKQPEEAVKKTKLDNANHPTTLVDISGTYQAGGMMGPSGPPKENYRMLVAVVETEQGPWFFKLVGPQDTIAARENEFKDFVRQAK